MLLITLPSLNNYRVQPVFRNNLGLMTDQTSDGEESGTIDYWSLSAYADKGSDEVDEENGSKEEQEEENGSKEEQEEENGSKEEEEGEAEDEGEQENSLSPGSTLQEAPQGTGLQLEAEDEGEQENSLSPGSTLQEAPQGTGLQLEGEPLLPRALTGCPQGITCITLQPPSKPKVHSAAITAVVAKRSETVDNIPGDLGDGSPSFGGYTNSRLELINKVSTEQELLSILEKFQNFMDTDPSAFAPYPQNLSLGKVTTGPTGALNIYYSWEPQSVIHDKYSILMLKFMDTSGQLVKKKIDYDILISNGSDSKFQKYGSTSTAVDLKIIDENTFPTKSTINPVDYWVKINVPSVNNVPVNESAQPMNVPQNP